MFFSVCLVAAGVLSFQSCEGEAAPGEARLDVTAPDGGLSFASEPRAGAEIGIDSNLDWYVTSKLDWLVFSPSSGRGGVPVSMIVVPVQNKSSLPREGVFSINSGTAQSIVHVSQSGAVESGRVAADPDDPAENERIPYDNAGEQTPPVEHDDPADPAILAWWTVGENDYMAAWNRDNGNCWMGEGRIPADWPEKSAAVARWFIGTDRSARTYILSSDGNGHWAVKPTWEGDGMEFTVPVEGLKSGDRLTLRMGLESRVSSVSRYWTVEYSTDGTSWTATSIRTFTEKTDSFQATLKLAGTSKQYEINESFTLGAAFSGDIRFRFRCVKAEYLVGGGIGTAPTDGSSIRLSPLKGDNPQNGIAIYLNKQ